MSYSRLGRRWLDPRLSSSEHPGRSQPAFMTATSPVTPRLRPCLALLGPLRAAIEYVSHRLGRRRPNEQGNGHPVIIFSGLGADGRSVWPLRTATRSVAAIRTDAMIGHDLAKPRKHLHQGDPVSLPQDGTELSADSA